MSRPDDPERAASFAMDLAVALHRFGTPSHRLEMVMETLCDCLRLEGSFFVTPTAIFASLGDDQREATHMRRLRGSEIDLFKLARLDQVFNEVGDGRLGVEQGREQVRSIVASPASYGSWVQLVMYALACGGAARFFGGGNREILVTFGIGLLLGSLSWCGVRVLAIRRLFEPLGGTLAAALAVLSASFLPGLSVDKVILGSLIVLIPGFSLTIAAAELANGHLVSGTARFAAAVTTFLMLGFGVLLGQTFAAMAVGAPAAEEIAVLPDWTLYVLLPVAGLAIALLFRAPLRDLVWILLVASAGFLLVGAAGERLGPVIGVFCGALGVGCGSNLFARLLDRPAAITRMPGLLFLVPGGLGFLSVTSLLQGDPLEGLVTAFRVALVAISLVVGLMVSSALVPPRKIL